MKIKVCGMFALLTGFVSAAQVDRIIVRQQWPWETSVKIEYRIVDVTESVDLKVRLSRDGQDVDAIQVASALTGDIYGIAESGLQKVIHTGYKMLNYLTFFTTGPDETRAWTVTAGSTAPVAAGKIHTDMQRGFIRMEVISYDDLMQYGSWNAAKEAGKLRIEGKEYVMQDGDCCFVRFSV